MGRYVLAIVLRRREGERRDSPLLRLREFESAAVFWFRDGKIVRWQPFDTYDAALKAAGLAAFAASLEGRSQGRRLPSCAGSVDDRGVCHVNIHGDAVAGLGWHVVERDVCS
jgi:hypothetical protein